MVSAHHADRPLAGRKVLVLRPRERADELADALRAAGAEPVVVPAVEILPAPEPAVVEDALRRRGDFDWMLFTSPSGVPRTLSPPNPTRVAAVGSVTARALEEAGVEVAFVPSAFTTEALGEELPGAPGRVLTFRAAIAGGALEEILRRRGFDVERVDSYTTRPTSPEEIAAAVKSGVDAVAITSASIARAFAEAVGAPHDAAIVSIGPSSTRACRELGLPVHAEADPHTAEGILAALEAHFAS
jgi:uroporphyrinogen-III synthase